MLCSDQVGINLECLLHLSLTELLALKPAVKLSKDPAESALQPSRKGPDSTTLLLTTSSPETLCRLHELVLAACPLQ
jgi:hypothetical protein